MNSPQFTKMFKQHTRYKLRKECILSFFVQIIIFVLTIIVALDCSKFGETVQLDTGFIAMLQPCLILIASIMPVLMILTTLVDLFNNKKILKIFEILFLIGTNFVLVWMSNALSMSYPNIMKVNAFLSIGLIIYLISLIMRKEIIVEIKK